MVASNNSSGYDTKLNQAFSSAMKDWWDGLSKEELLTYLAEQPGITADFLRQMLANENVVMGIGVKFSVNSKEAASNFHADRQ